MTSIFDRDLGKTPANHAALTPLLFLERAAAVYPDRLSVVHGAQSFTWRETLARCRRLASALTALGVGKNDTVSVMLPNTPPMYEAHFGVPMCGAVLNALNTRLDSATIAFMLTHAEAKVLITDMERPDMPGFADLDGQRIRRRIGESLTVRPPGEVFDSCLRARHRTRLPGAHGQHPDLRQVLRIRSKKRQPRAVGRPLGRAGRTPTVGERFRIALHCIGDPELGDVAVVVEVGPGDEERDQPAVGRDSRARD